MWNIAGREIISRPFDFVFFFFFSPYVFEFVYCVLVKDYINVVTQRACFVLRWQAGIGPSVCFFFSFIFFFY